MAPANEGVSLKVTQQQENITYSGSIQFAAMRDVFSTFNHEKEL
jgi:hypothetical protein